MTSGALYHLVTTCFVSYFYRIFRDPAGTERPVTVLALVSLWIAFTSFFSVSIFSTLISLKLALIFYDLMSGEASSSIWWLEYSIARLFLIALIFWLVIFKLGLFIVFYFLLVSGSLTLSLFSSSSSWSLIFSLDFLSLGIRLVILLERPKSQICMVQSSLTRMFSGFKSLWQMEALWR